MRTITVNYYSADLDSPQPRIHVDSHATIVFVDSLDADVPLLSIHVIIDASYFLRDVEK